MLFDVYTEDLTQLGSYAIMYELYAMLYSLCQRQGNLQGTQDFLVTDV